MKKTFIMGLLSRLYKMTDVEVSELLKISDESDEVDETLALTLIEERQSKLIKDHKDALKTRFDDGYKKAQGEALTAYEKKLKEKFNVDTDQQGEELISTIVNEQLKAKGGQPLTEEQVKAHPLFIRLEKEKATEVQKVNDEWEKKFNAEKESRVYETILGEVDAQAMNFFNEIGEAVLPENPTIAEKQKKRLLLDELRTFKFQKDGDTIIVLKEDGSRAEDALGHAIDLKTLVNNIAKENFQFKAATERKSPGNGGDKDKPKPAAGKYTGKAPKSKDEYVTTLMDEKLTAEQKHSFKEQFSEQFSG